MQRDDNPLLKVEQITKHFAGTKALDKVDLSVYRGEVHALLGENGAGKSTLIKVLSGMYVADSGKIWFAGKVVNPVSQTLPISFIHQDLGLIDSMTVGENVAIVAGYQRSHGLISWKKMNRRAQEILRGMGSDVDPEAKVGALSAAEKAVVGIARALAVESDLLVLDEPTAALPEADVSRLLEILRQLKNRGIGIIYVTHRIDEVFRIADTVTVLRDGKHVGTMPSTATDPSDLVEKIIGRAVSEVFVSPPTSHRTDVRLDVRDLTAMGIGPISFSLAAGEILSLVGLRGAGQELVGRVLFGDVPIVGGTVRVDEKEIFIKSTTDAIKHGIGYISSKRMEDNLAGQLTVRENLFPNVGQMIGRNRFIRQQTEKDQSENLMKKFSIRPTGSERVVLNLSGGNQQKVILARWLALNTKVLILEEPTSGVDVGAKAEIYKILRNELAAGISILLISSDFEEVATISHRALVFNRRRIVAEVPSQHLSVQSITSVAAGTGTGHSFQEAEGGRIHNE